MFRKLVCLPFVMLAMPAHAQEVDATGGLAAYVGVFVGHNETRPEYDEPSFPEYAVNPKIKDASYGVLAGVTTDLGGVRLGVEGDLGDLDSDLQPDADAPFNTYSAFQGDWTAHLRGRAGVDVGGAEVFVAGGLSWLRLAVDDIDDDYGIDRHTYTGASLGGGAEFSLGNRFGVRVEYLHDWYGAHASQIDDSGTPAYNITLKPKSDTVRAALLLKL